jgi:TRAP-type C4-dicarboxylate transport system permease small subunit
MFDKIIKVLDKIKLHIDKIIALVCISIVAAMTILVTYQVVVRYIFNSPSAISEVLSRYLFIWLVLFGGAYVFGLKEHMSITFIHQKFSKKIQIVLDMVSELVISIFAISIMVLGGYSITLRQMWQLDSALQIPMGVIYSSIPISGGLIIFYCLYNEIKLLNKLTSMN